MRAASHETLITDYVAIARLLGLPGKDMSDQLFIVTATRHWLEQQQGWLLILDNADDLSLLTDLLPVGGQGHLLLTTRAQATGKIAQSLLVETMQLAEGMKLVLRRAKLLDLEEPLDNVSASLRKSAQQLVTELDGLPLALDQAGAYVEETGCSLSEYLDLYRVNHLAMLQQRSIATVDYPYTAATTWTLSFEQVEQANPAAADLLRLCAFLHPDTIPEAIVTEGATDLGPVLSPIATDPLLLNEAIQLLRRYSLVKRDPEARLLSLHRLVQVVLKESLGQVEQRQWAERTVRAVSRSIPERNSASWEHCELYLPHALLCTQWIEHFSFNFPEAAHLLQVTGVYLVDRGQYTQAEPLLQRALSLQGKVLGPEHSETVRTLNSLANAYLCEGDYQQAERLLQPALANFERVLGVKHPEVTEALNTLASIYMEEGKLAQAEPLFQRALAIREQEKGTSPTLMADSLTNLGVLYIYQGKCAQAEPLYQRALVLSEHTQGPEHPDTLATLTGLASLYALQGKYAQAEPLYQRVLVTQERVLGPDHPDTAGTLRLVGWLYTRQGKYTQAESFLQHAMEVDELSLGPQHNRTIIDQLDLAELAQAKGQDAQAFPLYQQALEGFQRVLGPDHWLLAETLKGLAQLYTHQGHYQQAEPLLVRALAIDEQVLGPENPRTAAILDAQGYLAFLRGREEQAERLLQHALSILEQALGNSHPDVAQTLHHLAQLYEKQGKLDRALSLYQRALSIRELALGPDHPDTRSTLEILSRFLQMPKTQAQQNLTSQRKEASPD